MEKIANKYYWFLPIIDLIISTTLLLSIMITCAKVLGVGVDTHQPQYNKSTGYFESYQEFIIVNIMNSWSYQTQIFWYHPPLPCVTLSCAYTWGVRGFTRDFLPDGSHNAVDAFAFSLHSCVKSWSMSGSTFMVIPLFFGDPCYCSVWCTLLIL